MHLYLIVRLGLSKSNSMMQFHFQQKWQIADLSVVV
jgi:hypothetical protein